jgi:hypothetical protein
MNIKRASIAFSVVFLLVGTGSIFAQKGVDVQTRTIKDDANRTTARPNDVTRSIDFGKGKTRTREALANPYRLAGRRDVLMASIIDVLRESKLIVDEASSRLADGLIVTQPFTFARGSVVAQNELNRYAVVDSPINSWSRAQFTLTIEVQSIDGIQNNVSVIAKIEGRAGAGLSSEWITLRSSGLAEDDFLAKLVEAVTGRSVEPEQDTL